ncbi:MAG: LemA family protein [Clostridiales bacterium]|jgi:LemA protein|nr:LemA family protein [Clostridiales bacterium]
MWYVYVIIGAVALLLILWIVGFYNGARVKENNIENAFAQLDAQFKRRYDLIPNMVNTVKGYAAHEQETLAKIIALRNAGAAASTDEDKIAAAEQMSGVAKTFGLLVEQYPQLKADVSFNRLMEELAATENKIASFRQFYNDAILIFNRAVVKFPNAILAGLFRFKKKRYLETAAEQRENVEVKF